MGRCIEVRDEMFVVQFPVVCVGASGTSDMPRFGMLTSGRGVGVGDVKTVAPAVVGVMEEAGVAFCSGRLRGWGWCHRR